MSLAEWEWTHRARPVIELGIGDVRAGGGQARWDIARWDDPLARWSGDEPIWLDITCDVHEARCEYGRRRLTERFVPGVATILLDNSTGWADPNSLDEPGILTVRPGRPVRISILHETLGRHILFRGFVDAMVPSYNPTLHDVVELSCIDALGEVNRGKMTPNPEPIGEGDGVSTRIIRILDAVNWPRSKRDIQPSSEELIGDVLGGQVADLLGQAADSAGGSIFGDYEGRVAFRGRDWQTYAPGTPVEATIGNVGKGSPGIPPTIITHGYLTPALGAVSTPDSADMRITGDVRITCKFAIDAPMTANTSLVGQRNPTANSDLAFFLFAASNGSGLARFSMNGTGSTSTFVAAPAGAIAPGINYFGAKIDVDNGAGAHRMAGLTSTDGITWTERGWTTATPTFVGFDSMSPLWIGLPFLSVPNVPTRIYWAQMERLDADGNPAGIIWRFDADEYPGGNAATWADPRGRQWTVSDITAMTSPVIDPGVPATLPDVCPVSWERPFARADISTRAIMGRDLPTAITADDEAGITKYGIEPFERTDLLTLHDGTLSLLANRVLRIRGADTAPRVRSVSLDARTATNALDLMTTVDVYRPSRYRCRLLLDRGLVFDEDYFATGVAHTLTPSLWALELNLDTSAPFVASGGRWDGAYWDQATWATAPA